MIKASRLKDFECRQAVPWFPCRGVSRRDFAVFPVQGQRRQDVRWHAGGRGTQSNRGRCVSLVLGHPSNFPGSMYPKQMYFDIVLFLPVGTSSTALRAGSFILSSSRTEKIDSRGEQF